MKIVCESCGAKYSIADEKVAGKVFKIRCKKCSAVIVVKGDQPDAAGEEATKVFDYGADAVWHVVVGGDQQGPLAPRQIGELLAEGRIDWEAYVWREGMDGWQPAKDIDSLVSAVMAESEGGGGAPAAGGQGASYGSGQVFGGSSDMGADPFAGGDDGGLSGVMAQASAGGGASTDLFAQSAKSPFAGGKEDDDHPRVQNGSNPRISESTAMTGQRNENSVLFSLSNLQALATGTGAPPASTRPKAGMAQGEGSGLIDIRALASANQAVSERPNGHSKERVEDLLAVGAVNSTFTASALAAPVAQEKSDNSKLLLGFMAAAILLLGASVGFLALREPAATATAAVTPTGPEATAAVAPAAQAPTAAAPAADPAPGADEPSGDSPRADKPAATAREREDNERRKPRGGGDGPKTVEKPAEKPVEAAPAPAKSTGDKSIDDLLDSALSGKPAAKPAAAKPAAPAADLPSSPSRDDVISAMKGVAGKVSACGKGETGVAMTKITVTGATGKVSNVDVTGGFAGTPTASCIVREVSKAKFNKFSQSTFSVAYPFKL
jgi:predicted Zn finger-like uncharacterized protein